MRHRLLSVVLTALALTYTPVTALASSETGSNWFDTAWQHAEKTWNEGDVELYVPFLTYHLRFAYSDDKIDQYNEFPAGIGLGKGRYNSSGNWEGMYAMGFSDSHYQPSFMVGYGWVPTWNLGDSQIKAGVGLTGFLMSRQDYFGGIPFPGVLPIASLSYRQLALQAAYIPGGNNNGNVIFMWGKWTFD
jgi:lipid IVA palmitoyltransferase